MSSHKTSFSCLEEEKLINPISLIGGVGGGVATRFRGRSDFAISGCPVKVA
ncbi:MAG: hypothetical protein QXH37_04360 [Candidatus Bathyarchaeia archaeon]